MSGRMGIRKRGQGGAVLLEVLVALAVLGTVASAAAWRTGEWLQTVRHVHDVEAEVRAGQALLSAVSLWPRDDLDRHLGGSAQGPWTLLVERATPDLYQVALRDTASRAILLRTALYREPDR
jgi:type II secretory pathway pseudopilin PulG